MGNPGIGGKQEHERLYLIIDGAGQVDKYIDAAEEANIFEQGNSLNIWKGQTEAMLNHRCKLHGWTRESDIRYYLRIMLEEATKDDGAIDRKEFDHVVGFATALRMPRKDAIRISCELVRQGGWKTQTQGLLKKSDWLAEYERHF